jgi:hypothetical protein
MICLDGPWFVTGSGGGLDLAAICDSGGVADGSGIGVGTGVTSSLR